MAPDDYFDTCDNFCEPNEKGGFNWSVNGVGFGEFHFYLKEDKLMCSNEMMSKAFIKKVLCQMIDDSELDDPR